MKAYGYGGLVLVCLVLVITPHQRVQSAEPERLALPKGPITGQLTAEDPRDPSREGRHQKVFTWPLAAGKTYKIDLESSAFDAFLRLEDLEKKQLAFDDDSGGNLNARLVFTPARSGDYRIIVTSFRPGETGPFTLKVQEIGQGDVTHGELTEADVTDRVRIGRRCKVHQVSLEEGKMYQIDLESQQFDAYLRLEDSKTRQLAENDDGGSGLNARLVFTPSRTGTYRVIATTFGPGETGAYTLTVRQLARPEANRR